MRILPTLIAALALLVAMPARAEERITDFLSDVTVRADGALDVIETIHIVSEGDEIKRGIQRDFPTRYRGPGGRLVAVGFRVVDVARDGRPEHYTLLGMDNGERVRIGHADTLLTPGQHVYRIHYRTTRQLSFYSDVDELYWNATGNGWTFPIERAEARITLPKPVTFGKRALYTGEQGSTAADAQVVEERPGRIVFRTTRRLEAMQGLTVAAAWPKGVVAAPGALDKLGWWLGDWGAMLLATTGVIAMLAYWAHSVWRARRRSGSRPLVPLFSPPDGLSAAAVRYVWRKDFDDRTFSAAVVDTAVRGRLRIADDDAGQRLEQVDGGPDLPPAEEKMARRLFKSRKSVVLTQANHAVLTAARRSLAEELEAQYGEGHTFTEEPRKRLLGRILIVGLMLAVAVTVLLDNPRISPWTLAGLVGGMVIGRSLLMLLARQRRRRLRKGVKTLNWIVTGVISLATVFLGCTLIFLGFASGNPLPLLVPLLAIPFLLMTRALLVVPTPAGWALRDGIRGFRHYLAVAEEDRLDTLNPPEKTAALFERYLPYAMALEVENRWAKRFADIMATAGMDGHPNATGDWYVGNTPRPWSDSGAFAVAMGSALTSTIASAATSPSTSSSSSSSSSSYSGSSGDGSSGGGGGGGGGSGW